LAIVGVRPSAAVGAAEPTRHDRELGIKSAIRKPAMGRRNWLFIGSPDAGWRSAVIYSIVGSCRRRGIEPLEYLTDVLRRLPAMKANEVKDLVPARWKPAAE
jgi:hypothetical protein